MHNVDDIIEKLSGAPPVRLLPFPRECPYWRKYPLSNREQREVISILLRCVAFLMKWIERSITQEMLRRNRRYHDQEYLQILHTTMEDLSSINQIPFCNRWRCECLDRWYQLEKNRG